MITFEFGRPPASIVCLGAHPDDIEIGAAGTILHLAAKYPSARFRFVILSGTALRQEEAAASAQGLLGEAVEVVFGGFDENTLPYAQPAAVKAFVHGIAAPDETDLVFSPQRSDLHQDHRFIGEVALQAYRDHPIFGYEIPKYDGDLGRPQTFVPLSDEEMSAKLQHLDGHFASQHGKPWYTRDLFAGLSRVRGVECRSPTGFAEAFYVAKAVVA